MKLHSFPLLLARPISAVATLLAVGCYDPAVQTGTSAESSTDDTSTTLSTTTLETTAESSTVGPTTDPDTSTSPASSSESSESGPGTTTSGGTPEIEVSVDGTVVAPNDAFAFDTVDVAAQLSVTVTVANVGTGDLQVTGVLSIGPDDAHFAIDQDELAPVIAAGESSEFTVTFAPTNGGAKATSVQIGSDDDDENPFELAFGGQTTANTYRDLAPAAGPSARFNATLDDLGDGRLLLFGGRESGGAWVGDTWIFDVEAATWTEIDSVDAPIPRNAHETATAGDGTVVLFGGTNAQGGGALGDTWIFDVASEQWTLIAPSPAPPARFQHGMVPIGDGNVLLYGGRTTGGSPSFLDTWIFDGDAQTWSNAAPAGGAPGTSAFAIAWDGADLVTMYGGFEATIPLDITWGYTISTNTWAPAAPPTSPGARAVLQGEYLADGRMIVFSGKLGNCCIDPTAGTFAFDPVAVSWNDLAATTEPSPRYNYAMAQVAGRNKAIIFGGQTLNGGPGSSLAETWEYVGPLP